MKIFQVGKFKKADLSLSMNTIVILILAITLLGLGLTFLRGLFKNIESKVEEGLAAGQIDVSLTADRPMAVTPEMIEIDAGETKNMKLSFLNDQPKDIPMKLEIWESSTPDDATCGGEGGSTDIPCQIEANGAAARLAVTYPAMSSNVKKDMINRWTLSIKGLSASGQSQTVLLRAVLRCDEDSDLADDIDNCDEIAHSTDIVVQLNP